MYYVMLAVFLGTVKFTWADFNCNDADEELLKCARGIYVNLPNQQSNISSFAMTKDELNKLCMKVDDSKRCIEDFTNICMTENEREQFSRMYESVYTVYDNLCKEGTYQEEFLSHAPCSNKLEKGFEVCTKMFSAQSTSLIQSKPIADGNRLVCCLMNDMVSCIEEAANELCNFEAAKFMGSLMRLMINGTWQQKCSDFVIEQCADLTSATNKMESSQLSLFISINVLAYSYLYIFL